MAARTDLTWQELVDISGIQFVDSNQNTDILPAGVIYINVNKLLDQPTLGLPGTQTGVVKTLARLLDIARKAQEKANEGKPAGERIAAFPAPVAGTTVNGFVPITRSIAARHELASATSIIGTTA